MSQSEVSLAAKVHEIDGSSAQLEH